MKSTRSAFVLGLAVAVWACGGDDPVTIEIADLAGSWTATRFEFTDHAYPALSIDAISDADGTLNLTIQESGAFQGTLRVPDITVDPQSGETITVPLGGTFSINGSTLIVDFNAATEAFDLLSDFEADFTLRDDVLTIVNDDSSFDFPDDIEQLFGAPPRGDVPVTLTVRLVR